MLKWFALTGMTTGLILAGAGYWLQTRPKPNNWIPLEQPRHPVTKQMLESAEHMKKSKAPNFTLKTSEGETVEFKKLLGQGPIVIVFTLCECPCSIDAQPIFNSLAKSYAGHAQFLAIFKDKPEEIKKYGKINDVPYPMLADPNRDLISKYGARNSVYVALVSQDGRIENFWPGYDRKMIGELNDKVAALAGMYPQPVNLDKVPEILTSGCDMLK